MTNVYLKVTIDKCWRSQNFDFLISTSVFGSSNSRRYHRMFKLFVVIYKSLVWDQNCVGYFYYFNFERNYDALNKTESKIENPTHSFRETNLVLHSAHIRIAN